MKGTQCRSCSRRCHVLTEHRTLQFPPVLLSFLFTWVVGATGVPQLKIGCYQEYKGTIITKRSFSKIKRNYLIISTSTQYHTSLIIKGRPVLQRYLRLFPTAKQKNYLLFSKKVSEFVMVLKVQPPNKVPRNNPYNSPHCYLEWGMS